MHKICFIISLFHACTCFEHHVLIVRRSKLYYTVSGIITLIGGRPVHGLSEAWNKLIIKQILWIKLVNYWDKYTEMHGQQNIKINKDVSLMFIGPCIIVIVEEWKTNLMSLAILFHFLCTQHVSDINISIIRSLRLCCWITTSVAQNTIHIARRTLTDVQLTQYDMLPQH